VKIKNLGKYHNELKTGNSLRIFSYASIIATKRFSMEKKG